MQYLIPRLIEKTKTINSNQKGVNPEKNQGHH